MAVVSHEEGNYSYLCWRRMFCVALCSHQNQEKTTTIRSKTITTKKKKVKDMKNNKTEPKDYTREELFDAADYLAENEFVYYNFHNGHFAVQTSSGDKPKFSLMGTLTRIGSIYSFSIQKQSQQLVEVVEKGEVRQIQPKQLYKPIFDRELTAWDVVQMITDKPAYVCINILPPLQEA